MASGSRDAEGVPRRHQNLVKNGRLTNMPWSTQDAAQQVAEGRTETASSTGSANSGGHQSPPSTGCTELFLTTSEATHSWDQLLEQMGEGYVVNSVMGAHTANPTSGDFSVTTSAILKVVDGEVVGALKQAGLSGNLAKAMNGQVVRAGRAPPRLVLFGQHAPSGCLAHGRVENQPSDISFLYGILYVLSSLVRGPMEVKGVSNLTNPHESPPPVLRTGPEQQRLSEDDVMSEEKYADYVEAVQKRMPGCRCQGNR